MHLGDQRRTELKGAGSCPRCSALKLKSADVVVLLSTKSTTTRTSDETSPNYQIGLFHSRRSRVFENFIDADHAFSKPDRVLGATNSTYI